MPMTRDDARKFVQLYAATDVAPVLTSDEVEVCLTQCQLGDEDRIWATRAVVCVFDVKVAKAATSIDMVSDGTSLTRSQLVANLERSRASWRARCLPGSE